MCSLSFVFRACQQVLRAACDRDNPKTKRQVKEFPKMSSQLLAQNYELVLIDKLHRHPDNPRRGATDQIARSVARHGFYGAVVAQRSTGAILAGNHRWEAAKSEGLDRIPVVWIDVDDRVAKQILLSDNKISDIAKYADDALATVLLDLRAQNALDGSGYNEADLGDL